MLPVSEDYKSDALTISVNFLALLCFCFLVQIELESRWSTGYNMRLVYRGAKIQLANLVTIGKLDDKRTKERHRVKYLYHLVA